MLQNVRREDDGGARSSHFCSHVPCAKGLRLLARRGSMLASRKMQAVGGVLSLSKRDIRRDHDEFYVFATEEASFSLIILYHGYFLVLNFS
jgi:hypothetical protein